MTASLLAACITAGLFLQVAVFAGVWLWRRTSRPVVPDQPPPPPADSNLAWIGWREFRVTDRAYEDPTRTTCSFHLVPVDGRPLLPFRPGQFLTILIPVDGQRPVVRCYSLSEEPRADRYRITVKRVPAPPGRPELPPGAGSTQFLDRIRVGDLLKIKAPNGQFVVDAHFQGTLVFVAGGIGVTPLLCMLQSLLAEQPSRGIYFFYGARNAREQAFKAVLERLAAEHPALRLVVAHSCPDADAIAGKDYQHKGHIDIDLIRRTIPYGGAQFYVCGPPPMMASLIPALKAWGVSGKDIHFEAFGPASAQAPADAGVVVAAASFRVRWKRSGRILAWEGTDPNLLVFAERHGVSVESGCRSGSCGSCETRVVSGTVSYANDPDYPVAPGYCLLCVGRPASDLVLEA